MAKPMSKMARREAIEGYLFILPWLLGYLMFRLGPLLASLYLSVTNYDGSDLPKFIGFENYQYLFTQDPRFINSVRATFQFVAGYLPLSLIFGLSIAILMNQKVPGILAFRGIYYLPAVTTGVAVSLFWMFVFNKQFGVLERDSEHIRRHPKSAGWWTRTGS